MIFVLPSQTVHIQPTQGTSKQEVLHVRVTLLLLKKYFPNGLLDHTIVMQFVHVLACWFDFLLRIISLTLENPLVCKTVFIIVHKIWFWDFLYCWVTMMLFVNKSNHSIVEINLKLDIIDYVLMLDNRLDAKCIQLWTSQFFVIKRIYYYYYM